MMGLIVAGPPEVVVDYPEGPRVPEGEPHWSRRTELVVALRHWYDRRGVEDAWVCCNINVYYREGDPTVVVPTDVAVAFGVDAAAQEGRPTYKVWEAGAAPCFALEVVSQITLHDDLHVKPAKYGELGVDEYWRFDPTGGELMDPPLQGERRLAGSWVPIGVVPDGGGLRGRSEVLGLDLCWRPPKLRLWDIAAGAWLPDLDDEAVRADEEAAARRAADVRADEEAAARRAVEAELAELRARLNGRS